MIQAPQDNIIVTVTSKYTKDFGTLTKRLSISDATSVHLEDFANIVGTVVSLPMEISKEKKEAGYSMDEIKIGDKLIFAFNVIFDFYQKEHDALPLYRNKISYNAKDYWLADITKIFAIIREQEIIMINGFVMATPFKEDLIFTQNGQYKSRASKSSEVMHIGSPRTNLKKINVNMGDTIHYNPKKTQKYQINDKPFIILSQQQVLGKVN
jgi:co-chaperonin GroES (HSP10)